MSIRASDMIQVWRLDFPGRSRILASAECAELDTADPGVGRGPVLKQGGNFSLCCCICCRLMEDLLLFRESVQSPVIKAHWKEWGFSLVWSWAVELFMAKMGLICSCKFSMQDQIMSTLEILDLQCAAGFIACEIWKLTANKICNFLSCLNIFTCKYSKMSHTTEELNLIFPGI